MSLGQLVQQLRQIAQEGSAALDMGATPREGASIADEQAPRPRAAPQEAPAISAALPAPGAAAASFGSASEARPASFGSASEARPRSAPDPHPAKPPSRPVGLLIGIVLAVGVAAVVLAYFYLRRRREAAKDAAAEPPTVPPVPEALQRRIQAYAQRVVDQQRAEEQQEDLPEADEADFPEEAAAQQQPFAGGAGPRHVRFNERVTEYPIPARKVSRRAAQEGSSGGGGGNGTYRDEDHQAEEPPPEFPTLQISAAHRFEG
jgi:hypothetical protein